jgi:hypothetical protein
MSTMKNRRDRMSTRPRDDVQRPLARLEASSAASNLEFVRAFADALRDILRDERARIHG